MPPEAINRSSRAVKWKYCAFVSLAMVLLSLIPQIHLWIVRGGNWNGAYVSPQGDEAFYSGYVNALINGRTRKNDPFGAKDSSIEEPLPESIFSLQFIPAYLVALPARFLGVSASTAFIALIAIAAGLASVCVFWLLELITRDVQLATAGTLFVLCFGSIIGTNGIFGTFLDIGPAAFPFLRRYQPAAPFPLFFLFQLLALAALTNQSRRHARLLAILGGITLTVLIFSHLYLWTAAAACLVSICLLWFYLRPADRRRVVEVLLIVSVPVAIALLPYVVMLSHRAATLDEQQILILTRRPDLFRLPEIISGGIIVVLLVGIFRHRIERTDPRTIYVAALAFLPFIVFNQQILTGKILQPFHFEVAVVNYSTLVALVVTIAVFGKALSRRALILTSSLFIAFGFITTGLPARLIFVPQAITTDKAVPVLLRLKQLAHEDGTLADLKRKGTASSIVYSPRVSLIAWLPTWTSQGTLLDMTGVDCRGISRTERKILFFAHLYYSNADITALRKALSGTIDKSRDELASVQTATFGYERTSRALTPQFEPVRPDEVEREVQNYQAFVNSFSREVALKRPITYAVIPAEGNFDFTNLDRWYERDAAERVGDYVLYKLKLRP